MPGLTDFNLSAPTQSSKASADLGNESGGGLKDILGDSMLDELGKSRVLQTQLDVLNKQDTGGIGSILTSKRGLATLAASLGAILSGKREAQALGAGGLVGALQGAQLQAETERAQLQKAREEVSSQLDTSLDRQDKMHTRMAGLVNSSGGDIFNSVDAITGEVTQQVSPELLGWYVTGSANVPLFTTTKRILAQRKEQWDNTTAFLTDVLKTADNVEDARVSTKAMLTHLGAKATEEEVEAYARAFGEENSDQITWKNHYTTFKEGARDAHIFAIQNKLGPTDPQVLKMLHTVKTGGDKLTDETWETMEEIAKWELENPERVAQIIAGSEGDRLKAQELINQEAVDASDKFQGIDLQNVWKKQFGVDRALQEMSLHYQVRKDVVNKDNAIGLMTEGAGLDAIGMTKEELQANQKATAGGTVAGLKQDIRSSEAEWGAATISRINERILGAVPGTSGAKANQVSSSMMKFLHDPNYLKELGITPPKRNPDGQLDRADSDRVLDALTVLVIKELKEGK